MPSAYSFSRSTLLAVGLSLMSWLGASNAHAAEKYDIRLNIQPGSAWTFQSSVETQMTMQASAQGQVLENNEAESAMKRESVVTVKAATGGVPTAVEVAYSRNCSNTAKMNGQAQDQPFPLTGKTVNLRRGAGGQFSTDLPNADPAATAEVSAVLDMNTSLFPTEAVGVGDGWAPDAARIRQDWQLSADAKVDLRCKLAGVGAIRGRKTYDIAMSGTITMNAPVQPGAPAIEVLMQVGGIMQVDLLTGQPLQRDVVMKISRKGEQQVQGQNGPMVVTLSGGGKVVLSQSIVPKEDGAVANGPPPGGNPLDPQPAPPRGNGGNPLDPQPMPPGGGGGNNPLDPQPNPPRNNPAPPGERPANPLERPAPPPPRQPASPFAGAFKGEEMSADFTITGNRVTGTVTKAGKAFKVTGTLRENGIVGAFDVGGVEFNFVATLAGDTLTFDTDGNKYAMKKQAGAPANAPANNPPPAGRNPLD